MLWIFLSNTCRPSWRGHLNDCRQIDDLIFVPLAYEHLVDADISLDAEPHVRAFCLDVSLCKTPSPGLPHISHHPLGVAKKFGLKSVLFLCVRRLRQVQLGNRGTARVVIKCLGQIFFTLSFLLLALFGAQFGVPTISINLLLCWMKG